MTTTIDRFSGISDGVAIKAPVRASTGANITLSGLQTIDNIALVAGDRVLVRSQSNAVENGIWVVSTGQWTRAADFNSSRDVVHGTAVIVASGTQRAGQIYRVGTTGTILPGTTAITFTATSSLGPDVELANLFASQTLTVVGSSFLEGGLVVDGSFESIGSATFQSFANFNRAVNTALSANIASASTINLDTATGNIVDVTGNTTINTVTLAPGRFRIVRFTGTPILTHSANLVLPGAANITAAAGDYAIFIGYNSSVVRVIYFRSATSTAQQFQQQNFTSPGAFTFTTPSNITTSTRFKITLTGGGGSGANFFGGTGCGGNSGATCIAYVTGLSPSTGYSGTIGAGGASTSTNNTSGNAGGNTTITIGATTYTAGGGAGGTNTATPAANATATNGTLNLNGNAPAGGSSASTASSGAASHWGGGGRGNASGAGESGGAPGAGGGVAGGSGAASGAGANGIALIEWVA